MSHARYFLFLSLLHELCGHIYANKNAYSVDSDGIENVYPVTYNDFQIYTKYKQTSYTKLYNSLN